MALSTFPASTPIAVVLLVSFGEAIGMSALSACRCRVRMLSLQLSLPLLHRRRCNLFESLPKVVFVKGKRRGDGLLSHVRSRQAVHWDRGVRSGRRTVDQGDPLTAGRCRSATRELSEIFTRARRGSPDEMLDNATAAPIWTRCWLRSPRSPGKKSFSLLTRISLPPTMWSIPSSRPDL